MDIDFVLPWVDGGDPAWRAERARYAPEAADGDASEVRYRDWGTLKYWFRGVDRFAPWVRRVHFITWGHLPEWLNAREPRLHIVRHEDYIPKEYLPTFSSHPIELNMHRIAGLADRFVYFNDDVFLTAPVTEEDFFKNGLPCDTCRFSAPHAHAPGDVFAHILLNNTGVVNRHVSYARAKQLHARKWFSLRNGLKSVTRTRTLSHWPFFVGFSAPHLAVPFEKRTFEDLWRVEAAGLDATCRRRFRTMADISQLAARSLQLALGRFEPRRPLGSPFFVGAEQGAGPAARAIAQPRFAMICVNDEDTGFDFETERRRLIAAFETILPDKCAFER